MPDSVRIFISHSSHTEEERAFLRGLKSALEADDSPFRVLVDVDLYAGGDWNQELNEWMAECHAAVVLLTPAALSRPWVLKEVTTLVWRASLDASFPVLPGGRPFTRGGEIRRDSTPTANSRTGR